jgi:K+-transporting ATPase ATPase B chain
MFAVTYPVLGAINFLNYGPGRALTNPQSAVLAAVIFNALIIIALIPLALRGVGYRPRGASAVLRRNLLLYGVGGVLVPFPAIWIIDRLLVMLRLA